MDRRKVEGSALVASYGYDKKAKTLEVEFVDGAVYEYLQVPEARIDLIAATQALGESVGSIFHEIIKLGGYTYRRITPRQGSLTQTNNVRTFRARGPLASALASTKKAMGTNYGNVCYLLWVACGKEPAGKANSRYSKCVALLAEADATQKTISGRNISKAVALAVERNL